MWRMWRPHKHTFLLSVLEQRYSIFFSLSTLLHCSFSHQMLPSLSSLFPKWVFCPGSCFTQRDRQLAEKLSSGITYSPCDFFVMLIGAYMRSVWGWSPLFTLCCVSNPSSQIWETLRIGMAIPVLQSRSYQNATCISLSQIQSYIFA